MISDCLTHQVPRPLSGGGPRAVCCARGGCVGRHACVEPSGGGGHSERSGWRPRAVVGIKPGGDRELVRDGRCRGRRLVRRGLHHRARAHEPCTSRRRRLCAAASPAALSRSLSRTIWPPVGAACHGRCGGGGAAVSHARHASGRAPSWAAPVRPAPRAGGPGEALDAPWRTRVPGSIRPALSSSPTCTQAHPAILTSWAV